MAKQSPTLQEMPLKMVGSTVFGRYPKISQEETWNMIISDNWMVPYAGYKSIYDFNSAGKGRGIFNSTRYENLIFVIDNEVFSYNKYGSHNKIAELETASGDVFIDENNAHQIAICDKKDLYIFNYLTSTFVKANTGFRVGHVSFQDGYFIAANLDSGNWELSALNDGTVWSHSPNTVGAFQTKPDAVQACIRFPGRGNQLFVFGNTVVEPWTNVGYQLFPYQRSSAYNIDYGCANPATIASGDTFVIWLGKNEKSGLSVMYSSGGDVTQISNDGINFKLASVKHPEDAYGFLFKQDGHLIYQLTFPDTEDDFSFAYDFNNGLFFTLSDRYTGCHIAKRVAEFNGSYYFVSFQDGKLYEMSTSYTTYDGDQIPRIRVTAPIRNQDQSPFVVNELSFPIEQGQTHDLQRVDLSISRDSNDFGNINGQDLFDIPHRKNILRYRALGRANDFVAKFAFWGNGRFVFGDGVARLYQ